MRLIDFLILLLEAHAMTLQRLAALLGEEEFIELLENAEAPADPPVVPDPLTYLEKPGSSPGSSYSELEGAVRDFRLPAMLEFHLWAYPHYRAFIESPVELDARILGAGHDAGVQLVDEALAQAREWLRRLPLEPSVSTQAERAAEIPWLRFRTLALKRIGKRPLGPVY